MKKLILCLAILSVSLCIPALSHAAPALENYSGTLSSFHANFTYVDPATSKLKTVALNAAAPHGIKNAEISRETAINAIGSYSSILTQNDHGMVLMNSSSTALTSANGVTMSNVELVFYFWDGTVKYDPSTGASGTGNIYACETGGVLTFIPVNNGKNAVLKITNMSSAESIVATVTGGTIGTELPAMVTGLTLPAVTFVKMP